MHRAHEVGHETIDMRIRDWVAVLYIAWNAGEELFQHHDRLPSSRTCMHAAACYIPQRVDPLAATNATYKGYLCSA